MSKRMYDRTTFVAAILFFTFLWVMADADCATDHRNIGCQITNGKTMSAVFPRLKAMEQAFWHIVPG